MRLWPGLLVSVDRRFLAEVCASLGACELRRLLRIGWTFQWPWPCSCVHFRSTILRCLVPEVVMDGQYMHQHDPVGSCLGEAVSDFHTFTIKATMFSDGLSPVWNVSCVFPIVWYSFILLFHHVSSIFNIFLTPFCFIQELLPSSSLSTSSVAAAYDTTTELAAAPGARRPLDEQTEPRHRIFKYLQGPWCLQWNSKWSKFGPLGGSKLFGVRV